jgi:hypothetical protein
MFASKNYKTVFLWYDMIELNIIWMERPEHCYLANNNNKKKQKKKLEWGNMKWNDNLQVQLMPSQGEKKRELLHLSEDNDNLLSIKANPISHKTRQKT